MNEETRTPYFELWSLWWRLLISPIAEISFSTPFSSKNERNHWKERGNWMISRVSTNQSLLSLALSKWRAPLFISHAFSSVRVTRERVEWRDSSRWQPYCCPFINRPLSRIPQRKREKLKKSKAIFAYLCCYRSLTFPCNSVWNTCLTISRASASEYVLKYDSSHLSSRKIAWDSYGFPVSTPPFSALRRPSSRRVPWIHSNHWFPATIGRFIERNCQVHYYWIDGWGQADCWIEGRRIFFMGIFIWHTISSVDRPMYVWKPRRHISFL